MVGACPAWGHPEDLWTPSHSLLPPHLRVPTPARCSVPALSRARASVTHLQPGTLCVQEPCRQHFVTEGRWVRALCLTLKWGTRLVGGGQGVVVMPP